MKIAFLTEMGFIGKVPANHSNMRTEFAWMHALDASHYNIHNPHDAMGYDAVIVIFPKGEVYLNAAGSRLVDKQNPVSDILASDLIGQLKQTNKSVYYMQEGPHWWYNDYELADQIYFFNMLTSCDGVFAHNNEDAKYYKGLLPATPVHVMPTLIPTWGQSSHAMRVGEDQLFNHLPRVFWTDWMKQLSSFKYAVHLMPTVAAGTFSLNCAYFGIPCIGNKQVDTQRICHPQLSVDVHDLESARGLAKRLVEDSAFYKACSEQAKANYQTHYNKELFLTKLLRILSI